MIIRDKCKKAIVRYYHPVRYLEMIFFEEYLLKYYFDRCLSYLSEIQAEIIRCLFIDGETRKSAVQRLSSEGICTEAAFDSDYKVAVDLIGHFIESFLASGNRESLCDYGISLTTLEEIEVRVDIFSVNELRDALERHDERFWDISKEALEEVIKFRKAQVFASLA